MFGDFENIYKVFRQDDRLVAANGTLMKNKIFELASGLDEDFLQLLQVGHNRAAIFFKKDVTWEQERNYRSCSLCFLL